MKTRHKRGREYLRQQRVKNCKKVEELKRQGRY